MILLRGSTTSLLPRRIVHSPLLIQQVNHHRPFSHFPRLCTLPLSMAASLVDGVKTLKLENTEKRDSLIEIEKKYQKIWKDSKIFEVDAPSLADVPFASASTDEMHAANPKFFGTIAYPYMNGILHAGHGFTWSKAEFMAGWARMEGRRTLLPLGFHCTGMPIKACADKLVREIELFGTDFSGYKEDTEVDDPAATTAKPDGKTDVTKFSTKKSKTAAKTGNAKYQFQIMKSLGVPVEEIHKFSNPQHWIDYFPGFATDHVERFGSRVDWRRSFVTTDRNPYYDAFVRWQMNRLKEMGKIKFGKRYTVYSPKDGQPCLDHDRSDGEGVAVQEYTALKLKALEWPEKALAKIADKLPKGANVYFVPATLRPETMYGQVACFVGPSIKYGIYKVSETEYLFLSERSARNMSFQAVFPEWGNYPLMVELEGADVIGALVHAPLSVHTQGVRILPMESVKDTKGTAVVSCVPSDSPDDFATITDLAKKAEYYGIKREWAELEIIPVIDTPGLGTLAAPEIVKQMKINSPKDVKQLAEAKEIVYKQGFYNGTMVHGDFAGKSVAEAKVLVRQQLIDSGDAFAYAEPDGQVVSRSGDVCVAAHLDQWYLNYGTSANGGDGEWCDTVHKYVHDHLETYFPECKHQLEQTLGWLSQWACARSFGLGTKLPWDNNFIVESLSDSTVYMAYYTIAHFLHSDIYGDKPGSLNIKPEQMTDEVWDYVFHRTDSVESTIPLPALQQMRREFEYWYPLDVRVSGKDLIQNHLTFCLYIHTALFPQKFWPRSIRVNGHLLLNGDKMSKSTGNFLTLVEAVEKFGADATRISLADGGDGIEDANFDETVANASILRLFELRKWIEDVLAQPVLVKDAAGYVDARDNGVNGEKVRMIDVIQRTGELGFFDKLFVNEMNDLLGQTRQHYTESSFKSALKTGFYDFIGARDSYRESCKSAGIGMHHDLLKQFVRDLALVITPIAPHFGEYIWTEILKESSSIQLATYPTVAPTDPILTKISAYIKNTASNILSAEGLQNKRLAKGKNMSYDPKKDKRLQIFVSAGFPAWQESCLKLAEESYKTSGNGTVDIKAILPKIPKADMKKAMPFIQGIKRQCDNGESAEAVFDRSLGFDEVDVLKELVPILRKTIPFCVEIEILTVQEGEKTGVVASLDGSTAEAKKDLPPTAASAVPGIPSFFFENI